MIEIIGLHKKLAGQPVLKGIDLTINKGETLTVIGRSGEGKSVLLKHIIGLFRPDSGRILIDGEDITSYKISELYRLRRRFGVLFQGSALFDSLTVGENIGLGLREHKIYPESEIRRIIGEKLARVDLKGMENKKPAELSGGMKKRVGLARAIAMSPEYILYDEPTTGLDPITADSINNLIIELKTEPEITSIAVTHDMASAYKISDRIAMLHDGKIIFTGAPDEIKNSNSQTVQQFIMGKARGPITNF
ncbi:MAG: ABC transporter ATP-binding protein [Candidatus Zixiibacteriota bacterium]|nr:MAG: ABC transporter ATP-binding protein [candidate division Zixibacteria bacterium]